MGETYLIANFHSMCSYMFRQIIRGDYVPCNGPEVTAHLGVRFESDATVHSSSLASPSYMESAVQREA